MPPSSLLNFLHASLQASKGFQNTHTHTRTRACVPNYLFLCLAGKLSRRTFWICFDLSRIVLADPENLAPAQLLCEAGVHCVRDFDAIDIRFQLFHS